MALAAHLLAPLTRRFQLVLAAIGETSSPKLARMWEQLPAYNEENIEEFARKATPVMTAAKFAAVRQAAGYYALVAGVRPVGIDPDDVPVKPDLRAPFISHWLALKSGQPYESAVAAGLGRTDAVVRNLVASSAVWSGDTFADRTGLPLFWERIPDGKACAWCLEVSPGPILKGGFAGYLTAESADRVRHDRCGCTVSPVFV